MAIIKSPDRAPNASLGMIDYSTTARLGEKGIDLVTEAIQKKQVEDKIRYENAKAERKQAQVNLASFDAKVEANPELLEFLKTDDGVLGKAYDSYENGKMNYQDSLILTGGADSYITEKNKKIQANALETQAEVNQLTLDETRGKIVREELVGEALGKSIITTTDEKGNVITTFDPTVGKKLLIDNPRALIEFDDRSRKIANEQHKQNLENLELNLKLDKANTDRLNALATYNESEIKLAQNEADIKQATNFKRATTYMQGNEALGKKTSVGEFLSFMETPLNEENANQLDMLIENGLLESNSEEAQEAKQAIKDAEDAHKKSVQSQFSSLLGVNTATTNLDRLIEGPTNVAEFLAPEKYGLPKGFSGLPTSKYGYASEIFGLRSDYSQAINNELLRLTSITVVDTMLKLKEASPTGSTGFGAINQSELDLMKSLQGALADAQKTGKGYLKKTVEDFQYMSNRIAYKMFQDYRLSYGLSEEEALADMRINKKEFDAMKNFLTVYEGAGKNKALTSISGSAFDLIRPQEMSQKEIQRIEGKSGVSQSSFNTGFDTESNVGKFYEGTGFRLVGVKEKQN